MVTRGDTLYSLAGQTGTTVATIQQVNCLSGTQINDGQRIWLPAIPPTEPPTAPPTETPTLPPTEPPTVPPTPDGDVMVVRAWTADRNRIPKTTFEPGDPIEWVLNVENTTGSDAKIELTYELSDASGGSVGLWNGTVTAGAGTSEWALVRTVSPNTVGTNTFIGSGSYNVTTSEAVVVYNVIGPAPPEIISPTPTSTATLTPTPTWTPSPPPVVPPDLTVSGISSISSICPGGSGTCVTEVRFDVANVGSGNADAFNIRIVADPSQSVIVDQPFSGLASRDTQTLTITTPPGGGCFDPDCTVCVTVDSDQRITESDEGNNLLCETRLG